MVPYPGDLVDLSRNTSTPLPPSVPFTMPLTFFLRIRSSEYLQEGILGGGRSGNCQRTTYVSGFGQVPLFAPVPGRELYRVRPNHLGCGRGGTGSRVAASPTPWEVVDPWGGRNPSTRLAPTGTRLL